jgi:hypothetical protein
MLWFVLSVIAAVTGINKTTDAATLTYDPWSSACLDGVCRSSVPLVFQYTKNATKNNKKVIDRE